MYTHVPSYFARAWMGGKSSTQHPTHVYLLHCIHVASKKNEVTCATVVSVVHYFCYLRVLLLFINFKFGVVELLLKKVRIMIRSRQHAKNDLIWVKFSVGEFLLKKVRIMIRSELKFNRVCSFQNLNFWTCLEWARFRKQTSIQSSHGPYRVGQQIIYFVLAELLKFYRVCCFQNINCWKIVENV